MKNKDIERRAADLHGACLENDGEVTAKSLVTPHPHLHPYARDERDRLVQECSVRLIEAWGWRLLNPESPDLQALSVRMRTGSSLGVGTTPWGDRIRA